MKIDIDEFDNHWIGYLDAIMVFHVFGEWEALWVDGTLDSVVLRVNY